MVTVVSIFLSAVAVYKDRHNRHNRHGERAQSQGGMPAGGDFIAPPPLTAFSPTLPGSKMNVDTKNPPYIQ